MASRHGDTVTLKFRHGGAFKKTSNGLQYIGGGAKTCKVDMDDLCWWDLKDMASKCGNYANIESIYYLLPHKTLDEGLVKVYHDKEILEMVNAIKGGHYRALDLYVVHGVDVPVVPDKLQEVIFEGCFISGGESLVNELETNNKKKLTPKRQNVKCTPPTKVNKSKEKTLEEVLLEGGDDWLPEKEDELIEQFIDGYTDVINKADSDDEELREARERVKKGNAELLEIAERLRKQANEGKFGDKPSKNGSASRNVEARDAPVSDYEANSDEIHTPGESEEEDGVGRKKSSRALLIGENTNWKAFVWKVGQRFTTRDAFRDAIAHYAIAQGRNLGFESSNMSRLQIMEARCEKGCPFRVYGSWDKRRNCFVVKSVNGKHTCNRNMVKNRQLKASWLAKQLLEIFKSRPHWSAKEIRETVRRVLRYVIKDCLAHRTRYDAHKLLHGSMKEHYNKLSSYLKAMQLASPDTHLDLVTVPSKRGSCDMFQRLFICFDGLRRGWLEGCRRVLCVDACFLKTFLGGQLMAAIGRDANEQMYHVAWVVVEGENNNSYEWFFTNLQKCLQLGDGAGLTLISDEHQALIGAIAKILPQSEHRHCPMHIFAHWHKSFRGEDFKLKFWTAAKSYSRADFNEAMAKLAETSVPAEQRIRAHNPSLFCRSFLSTEPKVDVIVNNLAETFNGYIVNSRTKHLIYMLEEIRSNLMQRLVKKKTDMEKWNKILCPRVQAKLEEEKEKACLCDPMPSTASLFQVGYYMDSLNVDLEARSCTCNKWNLTGIPCCHAIACIYFLNREAEDFVHDCYKVETYMRSYSVSIPPIVGERHWPQVDAPLDPLLLR